MDAAVSAIVGTGVGAAIGFAGQIILARQRSAKEKDIRIEVRRVTLYEDMLSFVYDYERIVHRTIVRSTGSADDNDELMSLVIPLRTKLRLHASKPVRIAFSSWVASWVKYHERVAAEGEHIYALPNDGSRDEPLEALRSKLHAEEVAPQIEALEVAAATDLGEMSN